MSVKKILILLLLVANVNTLSIPSKVESVFSLVCAMEDMDEVEKYKVIRKMSESDLQKAVRYKGYIDNDFINEADKIEVGTVDDIEFIHDGLVGVNQLVLKFEANNGGDSGYSSRNTSNTSTPTDEKGLFFDEAVCMNAGEIVFSSSEEEEMEEELVDFEEEILEVRMRIDSFVNRYLEVFA